MGIKFTVQLEVEVDVDGWKTEYGSPSAGHAMKQVLTDLREPGWYLTQTKWQGLATVTAAKAQVDLGINEKALAAAIADRCTANAFKGTGTGMCDRPLDEAGNCDRQADHITESDR